MQYADRTINWTEWLVANDAATDTEKLAALREYIAATARQWVNSCTYDAAWANKKLLKMGITDLISTSNHYALEAPATGMLSVGIYAKSRAEAEQRFREVAAANNTVRITIPAIVGDLVFTAGPEDTDPAAAADAPATVYDTLDMLREIIMLGHIAGPHICEEEANKVLASYGLAPIPPRRKFVVARPVEAEMRTTVEAYDEASAERVARWRWENGRTGYDAVNIDPLDEATVTAADNVGAAN